MTETSDYIFPKKVANAMMKISVRTQLEAGLLSMSFIMVGLVFMIFYVSFYAEFSLTMKIFTIANAVAGIILIGSYLVTTFQQYKNHLNMLELLKSQEIKPDDTKQEDIKLQEVITNG